MAGLRPRDTRRIPRDSALELARGCTGCIRASCVHVPGHACIRRREYILMGWVSARLDTAPRRCRLVRSGYRGSIRSRAGSWGLTCALEFGGRCDRRFWFFRGRVRGGVREIWSVIQERNYGWIGRSTGFMELY